jgi:vacuolar-type H+-ATPase subunit H
MANIRELKKDINYVLGDIIEAVYIVEAANDKQGSKEGSEIIDGAITTFDELISKVNNKDVDNRKEHLKNVRKELEEKARALVDKLNKLP